MTCSSLQRIGWIKFSSEAVFDAARYAGSLAVGWHFNLLLLILLPVFGIFDRATRSFFITFGVAFALFVSLPVIASFKQPIIVGRYWLVGAPALTTLVTFAAWTWFLAGCELPEKRNMRLVAACGALLFLCASNIHGFVAARSVVDQKMIWRGAKIVRPLLDHCPAGSIHVATGNLREKNRSFIWKFSKMTGASPSLFVDAKLQSTPSIPPAMTPCPVLGWAEHIAEEEDFSQATDADLVQFLKIEASPGEVDVHRHNTGFVVLKRAPLDLKQGVDAAR